MEIYLDESVSILVRAPSLAGSGGVGRVGRLTNERTKTRFFVGGSRVLALLSLGDIYCCCCARQEWHIIAGMLTQWGFM